jgi:membrane protease YdiL (CAAX protease family)
MLTYAGGIIPLTVLGFAWAVIYTQSRNLLVTILIHGADVC